MRRMIINCALVVPIYLSATSHSVRSIDFPFEGAANVSAGCFSELDLPGFAEFQIGFTGPTPLGLEWVVVSDVGNEPDTMYETPGFGRVGYRYAIAKYEVTAGQYTEFLEAVAEFDTMNLYSEDMWDNRMGCMIERLGNPPDPEETPGPYTYRVAEDRKNRPVNFISWYDALRFANWLHHGKPVGTQNPSTTEDGPYTLSLGEDVFRRAGALVFLPNENEWYKAAYYRGGGTDAGYWDYPTQSNAAPTAEAPPGSDFVSGSANRFNNGYVEPDFFTTEVGAYNAMPSESAYGTFDQGGNVWEWLETAIDPNSVNRVLRGGSLNGMVELLHASTRFQTHPADETYFAIGFRVAKSILPTCGDMDIDGDIDLDDYAQFID